MIEKLKANKKVIIIVALIIGAVVAYLQQLNYYDKWKENLWPQPEIQRSLLKVITLRERELENVCRILRV